MKELSNILNGNEVFALLEDSKSEDGDSKNLLFTTPQEYIVAWENPGHIWTPLSFQALFD